MASIIGTTANDILVGSGSDDEIQGLAGDDVVRAGSGGDTVWAGPGNDLVEGGEGDDQIVGDEGSDTLRGGSGDDQIWGGDGNDVLDGGSGADHMEGGAGADTMQGGDDNDQIIGGDGGDILSGGSGDDQIWGEDGDDSIQGGSGADQMVGGLGNDTMQGGDGSDECWGEDGEDVVDGGDGNDYVSAGAGDDRVSGGAGDDRLYGEDGNDLLDGGPGRDELFGGPGTDTAVWPLPRSSYVVLNAGTYLEVRDLTTGEIDKVDRAVEFLQFLDRTVASSDFGPAPFDFFALDRAQRLTLALAEADDLISPTGASFEKKVISYSFEMSQPAGFTPAYLPAGETLAFTALTPYLQASARSTFALLSSQLDVDFIEVTEGGDIQFGMHNMTPDGYASSPDAGRAARVMISSDLDGEGVRGRALYVMLHELGHALGLDHSFDNSIFDGGEEGFGDTAPSVPIQYDTGAFTVMTYREVTLDGAPAASFQALDMAALVKLYGERISGTSTTYKIDFNPAAAGEGPLLEYLPTSMQDATWTVHANAPFMIFDTGGDDTIDLAGCQVAALVDLRLGLIRLGQGATQTIAFGGIATDLSTRAPMITLYPTTVIESVVGTWQADQFVGGEAAETFAGGGGDDSIDGGMALDMAVYWQNRDAYAVLAADGQIVVSALRGSEGVDTLIHVERLLFRDGGLAFDLDGHAGTVARLLGAVFGRAEVANRELAGLGLEALDNGTLDVQLAQVALNARLGPDASAHDVVALLYENVVGSAPTTAQANIFILMIEGGQYTPASLALFAAETDLNAANIDLTGLAAHGLEFVGG